MSNKFRIAASLVLALVLVVVLAAGCTVQSDMPATEAPVETPDASAPVDGGPAAGSELDENSKTIAMYCSRCHAADFSGANVDDWRATVELMVSDYGAQLTPEQMDEAVIALEAVY